MHQLWQKQELSHYFWVKLQSNLRCFLKNLHNWQEFYTTAGHTGRAKYQLWKHKECSYWKYIFYVVCVYLIFSAAPTTRTGLLNSCFTPRATTESPQSVNTTFGRLTKITSTNKTNNEEVFVISTSDLYRLSVCVRLCCFMDLNRCISSKVIVISFAWSPITVDEKQLFKFATALTPTEQNKQTRTQNKSLILMKFCILYPFLDNSPLNDGC